jgi:hypothetical protein
MIKDADGMKQHLISLYQYINQKPKVHWWTTYLHSTQKTIRWPLKILMPR